MKIVYVCNEYPPALHGGIGVVTKILSEKLVERGHQVNVVGVYQDIHANPEIQCENGVIIRRIPSSKYRKFGWIIDRIRLYLAVKRICQDGVDIIDVPDYQGMAAFWPPLSAPVIVRIAGSDTYNKIEMGEQPNKFIRFFENMGIQRGSFFCAKSNYAGRRTEQIFMLPPGIVKTLYNPVLFPINSCFEDKVPGRVIFSGTLVKRKGIISLFQAWKKVFAKIPSATLHIYGKDSISPVYGSMQEYLLSILENAEKGSVIFYGHVSQKELFRALAETPVAVFPSYSETFGNAPVEAMVHACATIYTRRSCGPEIIEENVDGLLVDPDNPDEIADAILRLLTDKQLAHRLGKSGYWKIRERFSVDTVIPENENFYLNCIHHFKQREIAK